MDTYLLRVLQSTNSHNEKLKNIFIGKKRLQQIMDLIQKKLRFKDIKVFEK
jgi:hypothetical protein